MKICPNCCVGFVVAGKSAAFRWRVRCNNIESYPLNTIVEHHSQKNYSFYWRHFVSISRTVLECEFSPNSNVHPSQRQNVFWRQNYVWLLATSLSIQIDKSARRIAHHTLPNKSKACHNGGQTQLQAIESLCSASSMCARCQVQLDSTLFGPADDQPSLFAAGL